jgi:flagellar protein FlaG
MKIDQPIAAVALNFESLKDSVQIQSENREIIQAVRAVNASVQLGNNNELTFSLDRQSRRPIIKIVNRETNEVVQQIPNEQVLRLAEQLKLGEATDK